jgi:iron complex outermembrane receptor protein
LTLLLPLVFLFLFPGSSGADEAPPADVGEVGFGKAEASEPDNQAIITEADILAMKVTKLHDALNQVPGVSATNSSISIHGSSKVRVFVDGTPLNDPTAGHGSINFDLVALQSVEKIVIIKDSGGLRYGQDASAGVVLITTKTFGSRKPSGQLRVWYGTQDSFKADGSVSASFGQWGVSAKAGYDKTDGYKINNASRRLKGGFKIGRSFGENKSVFFSLDGQSERKGMSGYPESPTPNAKQKGHNYSATLAGEWKGLSNNLYYNVGRVANRDESRNLDQSLTVAEYGDSLTFSSSAGPLNYSLGAGFRGMTAESSGFGRKTESVVHFYGAGNLKPFPRLPLTLSAGLRYNLNSGFANSFNPEGAVSLRKGMFEVVYKINRAVNTPTFQQRFNHSSSTVPNPDLSIEKVLSQNLSVVFEPNNRVTLNASVYRNALKGRISYVRDAGSSTGQYQNLGTASYEGFDFGFSLKFPKYLELKGRYAYLVAKDEDLDLFLTGQSRHYASLEVLAHPTEKAAAALKLDYRDRCFTDRLNTARMPGRLLVSARAEYDFGFATLFVDGTNILGKDYKYADGLEGPPMELMFGLKRDF